ncbi:ABC transporter substrate-binding protein [Longispora albida]|uniref:ABC transporter substrate-binding protein n=1 Tax=Longispora albida TaxID=203523 RepID=UPI0003757E0A|nr:ABC transporter substrate-binding protein [Longispora albida]
MSRARFAAAVLFAAALTVTGCSAEETGKPDSFACSADKLPTLSKGKLTVGTDNPVYGPWFVDNKPENGQGFESAVAYAVAEKLGYTKENVVWTRVTFNNAIAPGPKTYDFDINEFSITEDRKKAVDFSSGYYDVRQTVIALRGSKIAGVTSVAGLKGAKLGAQVGTTSYKAITDVVKPDEKPAVYNNNDDAKAALANGSIDGLVVDLPTAFYMTSAEIKDSVIVGQLPQPPGVAAEQFGLVLDKGSKLTSCVSTAVDQLRSSGKLGELAKQWLAGTSGARELT